MGTVPACGLAAMPGLAQLYADTKEALSLTWVAGNTPRAGEESWGESIAAGNPVGYFNLIHPGRIQVIGKLEDAYLERSDPGRRDAILNEIENARLPAVVKTDGVPVSPELLACCERSGTPLFVTPLDAELVIETLRHFLAKLLAQRTSVHGVLMDLLGVGVLITGESGLGKSELALELISRGHGLVADDVVELARIAPKTIEGRCPPLLTNLLEVRGLGLLDIKAIFGETAVRRKMRLRLIVHLVKRTTMESQYQRMPLDVLSEEILGINVRKVVIPVDMGRNIAVLAEAAVRNTILQLRGIDTMGDFLVRQTEAMRLAGSAGSTEPGKP
jgi:HPr kinase/phosphorylase